jgi:hypothetical protein
MNRTVLLILVTLGCGQPKNNETDSGDTAGYVSSDWSLLADEIGNGALLSAWTDLETTQMVGGDMHGGPGLRVAYDGHALCIEANITERALWWIHGDRPGRWVAVGEAGTVLLQEDGARTRLDIDTSATLYGTWVTSNAIIAVGGDVSLGTGEVWRHDGTEWTALSTDLPGVAFKVWEDWIVGSDITYRLESDNSLTTMGNAGRLLTVRGDGEITTAVGGVSSSLIMQHDQDGWTERDSAGLGQPLNGIWTDAGQDIWIAGNFGTTARLTADGLEQPDWPVTSHHFHAVWPHAENEFLFVGGNFMSTGDNFGTIARYGPVSGTTEITEVLPCE